MPGGVRVMLAALLAAGLIVLAAHEGLVAALIADGRPAAALRIDPGSAEALGDLADEAYRTGAFASARRYATAALSHAPLDSHAMMTLALADAALGIRAPTTPLVTRAAELGWRDPPTQLALIRLAAASGDRTTLAQRLDAMARMGVMRPTVFAMLRNAAADPAMRPLIAERLAQQPDWRFFYLNDLGDLGPAQAASHRALLATLADGPAPPTRNEVSSFALRLLSYGEPGEARAAWATLAPKTGTVSATGLYDGGFRSGFDAVPFTYEWSVAPESNATIAAGQLRVDTPGNRDIALAGQTVALSPGAHRFTVEGSATIPSAFAWTIRCDGRDGALATVALDRAVPGADGWMRIVLPFAVPPGCPAQRLELRATQGTPPRDASASFRAAAIDG